MTDTDTQFLDYIPEDLPPYSLTSDGLNWPAADSAEIPWAEGVVACGSGDRLLPGFSLDDVALADMALVDGLGWSEVDLALVVSFANGWRSLLLVTCFEEDGQTRLEAVAMPMASLERGALPPQFRAYLGREIAARVAAGEISVVEDNMQEVIDFAQEVF